MSDNKPKFTFCAIARNEAKYLPRLLSSLESFRDMGGQFCLLDTGSTDDTVKIARDWGARVEEVGDRYLMTVSDEESEDINAMFCAENEGPCLKGGDKVFSFADARNMAATLSDCDMVSFVDCDEEMTKLDVGFINSRIDAGITQFEYHFIFAHDSNGRPAISFKQSKFYDRRICRWKGIIHEMLEGNGRREYLDESAFLLEHWQNKETDRSGYLKGLALDCYRNLDNDRNSHYFAREMMWRDMPKSALKEFGRHVAMNRWPAERGQSLTFMGDIHAKLGNEREAIRCWSDAFELEPKRRAPLMSMAWHHYGMARKTGEDKVNRWRKAVAYAAAALSIPRSDFYANRNGHYTYEPHEILYTALGWLGEQKKSKEHYLEALRYFPNNPRYLHDSRYYFDYRDRGISGWMTPLELDFLYSESRNMNDVIEIGSWKGRSTHALLTGCRGTVTAVDHFNGSDEAAHVEAKENDSVYEEFMRNVGHFPNLKVERTDSISAARYKRKFDMVFIDASHDYEGVRADIAAWKDKARVLLCGHDYCPAWPGVMKAVDEAFGKPDGVVGSIWWKRIGHNRKLKNKWKSGVTELCDMAEKYRSDKCPKEGHNYTPFYDSLFKDRREDVKRVLEIGVGCRDTMKIAVKDVESYTVGASLFMWQDYFKNADIFSCDINKDILVNEGRIKSYRIDQSQSAELFGMIDVIGKDFDLILDDGSHVTDHQVLTAIDLIPYVKEGGYYIIEDVKEPERIAEQLRQFGHDAEIHKFDRYLEDDCIILIRK